MSNLRPAFCFNMETVELSNFLLKVYTLSRLKKYFGTTYEKCMVTSHLIMPLAFALRDQDVFKMVFAWDLQKTGSTSTYIMILTSIPPRLPHAFLLFNLYLFL